MAEPLIIITLVSSIVMPIVTSLTTLGIYAVRKLKKSSCMNCFSCESNDNDVSKVDLNNAPKITLPVN